MNLSKNHLESNLWKERQLLIKKQEEEWNRLFCKELSKDGRELQVN